MAEAVHIGQAAKLAGTSVDTIRFYQKLKLIKSATRSNGGWDSIAVYAPGTLWQDTPPKPVYFNGPVRDVIDGAKNAIKGLMAGGTNPTGGYKR